MTGRPVNDPVKTTKGRQEVVDGIDRMKKAMEVGTVGEKETITATVSWKAGFDSQFGYVTMTGLRDADGNTW
jgi:hypothetical protein